MLAATTLSLAVFMLGLVSFGVLRVSAFDPDAPPFTVITNDGETIEILDYIVVDINDPNVFRLEATVDGDAVGEMTVSAGETVNLLVDSSAISHGSNQFEVTARDLYGEIVATASIGLVVEHPTLSTTVVEHADGTRDLEFTFKGLDDDQIFAIYLTPNTDPEYSSDYDVLTPGDLSASVVAEMGVFPEEYSAESLNAVVELDPVSSETTIHLVLLTFQYGQWRASNATTVTVTPAPAVAAPTSAPK